MFGGPESGLCTHYQIWAAAGGGSSQDCGCIEGAEPGHHGWVLLGSGSAATAARPDLVLGSRLMRGRAGGYSQLTGFLRDVRPAASIDFECEFETPPGQQAGR